MDFDDCLPQNGIIRDYCEWIAPLTHVPKPFHLASILPGAAYEMSRRGLHLPVFRHITIWVGLLAPSGTGKTFASTQALEFIEDWQTRTLGEMYVNPIVDAEGSLPGVIDELSRRFHADTGTTPVILSHSEFAKVLVQQEAADALCLLYDGRNYERNLRYFQKRQDKGERAIPVVQKPVVSSIFSSTRVSMERVFTTAMVEGGLFSRILWLFEKIEEADVKFLPDEDPMGREVLLDRWAQWSSHLDGMFYAGAEKKVAIKDDALEYVKVELFEMVKRFLIEEDRMSAAFSRAVQHAIRIAAIYAVSSGKCAHNQFYVDLDSMKPAVNFVRWSLRHAEMLINTLAVDPLVRLQHKVQELVRTAGRSGVCRSDIYRKFNLTKKEVDPVVQALLEQEVIVESKDSRSGPGRPKIKYFSAEALEELRTEVAQAADASGERRTIN